MAVACRLGTCTWPSRPTCHVHDGPCTRPCTGPVYTAVYWPCTRPCIWRVHGLLTAVYTYACVHGRERAVSMDAYGRVGPCRRPCTCRVQGRGPCTRLVRNVVLRFSLQKIPFMPKRTATNPLHSKKLGQLALLASRCGGQQYYAQCS